VSFEAVSGNGTARRTRIERGRSLLEATEPGLYRMTVVAPPGYEPPSPEIVEILPGEPREVVLELVRGS
jgi:hypothetical protein